MRELKEIKTYFIRKIDFFYVSFYCFHNAVIVFCLKADIMYSWVPMNNLKTEQSKEETG